MVYIGTHKRTLRNITLGPNQALSHWILCNLRGDRNPREITQPPFTFWYY